MSRSDLLGRVGAGLLATGLLAGAASVQAARERLYPVAGSDRDALYVTSGTALRRMSLSYRALAADLYWIRSIQYFGGTKRDLASRPQEPLPPPLLADVAADSSYELLYPLLDLTTSLDPRFNIAYRFGAIFLAEPYPGGPGRPDLAIALLEKGLRERPDRWEYMQDIGFVHYWWDHDYKSAGAWFARAADVPGAPWWLRPLAATTLAQGGDRGSSRAMWRSIRESAEIEWLRSQADKRLAQFDALDQIDTLQRIIDQFAQRSGAAPVDWPPLIRAHALGGVPIDPSRTPYVIGEGGRVELSQTSPLWPLPEEPKATGGGAS